MAGTLNFIDDYRTGYSYLYGGNGDGGGIDCSHLVYQILHKAGYNFPYKSVANMFASGKFEKINASNAKPGDLVVFINHQDTADHVGILIEIKASGYGKYFGSQSSTGPAETDFGPGAYYWPSATYFLRPIETNAAPTQPPTPQYKPLNWAYPVKLKHDNKQFKPAAYFKALSTGLGGTYPLGRNGLLHPGIHFDQGTAALVDLNEVYAIADGQIVAYRMDPEPLTIRYPDTGENKKYSSSFVLIKHRLELPPLPATARPAVNGGTNTSTNTATTPPSQQASSPNTAATASASAPQVQSTSTTPPVEFITLYSLYMHLADAKRYQNQAQTLEKPPYLAAKYKVKDSVNKPVMGLRVRDKPGGVVLGLVPLLASVQTGAPHRDNPRWKKFNGLSGAPLITPDAPPAGKTPTNDGYIFTDTLSGDGKVVSDNDNEPSLLAARVTHIYNQAKTSGRKIIANLPPGSILTLGAKSKDYEAMYEVTKLENTQPYPPPQNTAGGILGWIDINDLEELPVTPATGVQLINPPIEVKAGQLIGHPGIYQHHNNSTDQELLHIELFTPDDLPGFIDKSRAWAAKANLTAAQKTLLKVPKGTKIAAVRRDTNQTLLPPNANTGATEIHSELILPLSALSDLPAEYKQLLPESNAPNAKKFSGGC